MSGLQGHRALVTGAGRGIGRAIAEHLGAEGVAVAIVARTGDEVEEVATALFVHPQTVRYRMTQLRDLFGDRLTDGKTAHISLPGRSRAR